MKSCYYRKVDGPRIAVLDNCDYYNEGRIITRINVPAIHRGKGVASTLLAECCQDADSENITLWLEIMPSDGLDYDQLAAWYGRYGFRDLGGIWQRRPQKK